MKEYSKLQPIVGLSCQRKHQTYIFTVVCLAPPPLPMDIRNPPHPVWTSLPKPHINPVGLPAKRTG